MLIDFIENGLRDYALTLVDLGADPGLRGANGDTPLAVAAADCHPHIDCPLKTYDHKTDPVTISLQRRLLVERLLAAGVDAHATIETEHFNHYYGGTASSMEPLELACLHLNVEVVECLLAARAKEPTPDRFMCADSCLRNTLKRLEFGRPSSGMKVLELLIGYSAGLESTPINPSNILHDLFQQLQDYRVSARRTPLSDRHIVRMLLESDADPRYARTEGVTSFELAFRGQRLDVCDMMVRRGFRALPEEIQRFWHFGLEQGSVHMLEYVMDINKYPNLIGKLLVEPSALARLLESAEWEIERLESFLQDRMLFVASNPNTLDFNDALMAACLAISPAIAEKLIEAGADANVTKGVVSPLLAFLYSPAQGRKAGLVDGRKRKLMDLLLQHGADVLHLPTFDPDDMEEQDLDIVANVNTKAAETPIGSAIVCQDHEALGLMFQYNPGILKKDPRATDAPYLDLAVMRLPGEHTTKIVAHLLRNGADPTVLNNNGQTALGALLDHYGAALPYYAGELAVPRLVRMLWHDEIDINTENPDGDSIGGQLAEMLSWQRCTMISASAARDALLKDLSFELGKHVKLTKVDGEYSMELRPIQETLSRRIIPHRN